MIRAVGIDLGTTNCSVAVWQNGRVEVLASSQGNRSTPSFVAFNEGECLLGDDARNQVAINPTNTIFDIKRLLGRRYEDAEIQADKKLWPFRLVNILGRIMLEVAHQGCSRLLEPEEVAAFLLLKLKEAAEAYLGCPLDGVVLTIPAYFDELQRRATLDAAVRYAHLKVLMMISEPTAAALAYRVNTGLGNEGNILVFDLGGGTFDVSILSIRAGSQFEVIASEGITNLGGKDFDDRLVEHVLKELKNKHGKDFTSNFTALHRIRFAAERAKRNLSSTTEAVIEIDGLLDGTGFCMKITRAKFEDLCSDFFQKIVIAVKTVLTYAEMSSEDINDVILVGGSTRMPKIRHILKVLFSIEKLKYPPDAEETVVSGAAIQAAILSGETDPKIRNLFLIEIQPLSLGIETAGGIMAVIVRRGTRIPYQRIRIFTTFSDEQSTVKIEVYEGEHMLTKKNKLLSTFTLEGIPSLPRGIPKIEVTFSIDNNGLLHIRGREINTGSSRKITIEKMKIQRFCQNEIEKMLNEAREHREEEERNCMKIEARNKLEKYVHQVKQALKDFRSRLKDTDVQRVQIQCEDCIRWLKQNRNVASQIYEYKCSSLQNICNQCVLDHE